MKNANELLSKDNENVTSLTNELVETPNIEAAHAAIIKNYNVAIAELGTQLKPNELDNKARKLALKKGGLKLPKDWTIDMVTPEGFHGLSVADRQGFSSIININNINSKNELGMTKLMYAVRSNCSWHKNTQNKYGATQSKDENVIKLLNAGADVNAKDEHGCTALMFAVTADYLCFSLKTIEALIAAGANINAKDEHNESALTQAVRKHKIESVEALIAAGANVNESFDGGWTPLLLSIDLGNQKILEMLLSAGADASVKTNFGTTALMMVPRKFKNTVEISKILISAGADIHAENNFGETAMSIAEKHNKTKLVRFLDNKVHEHIVKRKSVLWIQPQSYEYSF
jgi:ankyrin repeat protein